MQNRPTKKIQFLGKVTLNSIDFLPKRWHQNKPQPMEIFFVGFSSDLRLSWNILLVFPISFPTKEKWN
jgi:hypothetical protein